MLTERQTTLLRGASEWIGISSELLASRIFDILEKTRRLPIYKQLLKKRANDVEREVKLFHHYLNRAVVDWQEFTDNLDDTEDRAAVLFTKLQACVNNALRIKASERLENLPLILETVTGYLFAECVVYGIERTKDVLRAEGLAFSLRISPDRMMNALRLFLSQLAGPAFWPRICKAAATDTVRDAVTECYITMLNTSFGIEK